MTWSRFVSSAWGAMLLVLSVWADGPTRDATDGAFFEKDVLPILKDHCFKCHGEGKVRGGLRLTSREAILEGGEQGPAVSLKSPESSRLLQAINHRDGLEMPPKGKLAPKQIEMLTRWVKAGLPWPAGKLTTKSESNYWAYQPVRRPPVPTVKQAAWLRNPVDAFILTRLESEGLMPAAPADRVALLRRVTYDLTGLP